MDLRPPRGGPALEAGGNRGLKAAATRPACSPCEGQRPRPLTLGGSYDWYAAKFNLANDIRPFLDREKVPYLHLVDGGVADNLGLRVLLSRIGAQGNAWNALKNSDKPNAATGKTPE